MTRSMNSHLIHTRVFFPTHNPKKLGFGGMGRAPCCDKANVKKGPWSPEEDTKLKEFIDMYGTGGNWISLPSKAGLKRCGKSCRLRWLNYLRPNIKHGEFSDDEDRIICSLFASIGSRWSIIAARLPGRTDNDIKNYWNTKLKKKLLGLAPSQRKPHHPQQQQMLFSSPSPSSHTTQKALLTSLDQAYPIAHHHHDMFITSNPSLLLQDTQQYQMKDSTGSNLLMFGGHEQSCSSSDGSCNQISHGQEMKYKIGVVEQMMGFDQGYPHGGIMENQEKGNGLWNDQASLEYGYEEIKQLLIISSSGCNSSIYVQDDPAATSSASAAAKGRYRTQGKIMYNF